MGYKAFHVLLLQQTVLDDVSEEMRMLMMPCKPHLFRLVCV